MYLLMLTAIPHYFAIIPSLKCKFIKYNLTILLSTTFSIIWHYNHEPNNIYMYIDYLFVGLWFWHDITFGFYSNMNMLCQIFILNCIIFFLQFQINENNYILEHSIWHLVSSFKCIYISNLIQKYR